MGILNKVLGTARSATAQGTTGRGGRGRGAGVPGTGRSRGGRNAATPAARGLGGLASRLLGGRRRGGL